MPCRSTSRTISTSPGSNTWSIATDGMTTRSGFTPAWARSSPFWTGTRSRRRSFFWAGSPTATGGGGRCRGAGARDRDYSYAHRLVYHQRRVRRGSGACVGRGAQGLSRRNPRLSGSTFSIRADTPGRSRSSRGSVAAIRASCRSGAGAWMAGVRDMPYEMANGLLEFPMSTVDLLGRRCRLPAAAICASIPLRSPAARSSG